MNTKLRTWCAVLFVACLALSITWQFGTAFGQQGGAGGAGGAGGGGRGGPGGAGASAAGGRGGAGGMAGGLIAGSFPGSVSATAEFVYVVHNDTLYQFAAQDLTPLNRVPLLPPPERSNAPAGRK